MANYLDSLLTALRQLNSQMENRRGNLSEMSSLRVEPKSDSSPTCVYNRKSFTGERDGVCLANCRMPAPMFASEVKQLRFCLAVKTSRCLHLKMAQDQNRQRYHYLLCCLLLPGTAHAAKVTR